MRRAAACLLGVLLPACVPSFPAEDTDGAAWPDEALLNREAPCELDPADSCGYPEGPYSPTEGQTFPNIQVNNCAGEAVELAELFQVRPDTGRLNRGVVFAFGAGWCTSCITESEHFATLVHEYREPEYDVEFLHFLIEGNFNGSAADANLCDLWDQGTSEGTYNIWYTPDPNFSYSILPPNTAIPYLYILDANAHVRYAAASLIDDATLEAQIDALVNDPYGP